MIVSDDGNTIRVTVHKSTWVMPGPIAAVVRSRRKRYADSPVADTAFLDGFLCSCELAHELAKAGQNGKA